MNTFGERFVYGKINLTKYQLRLVRCRAEVALRECELARKFAASKKELKKRVLEDPLPLDSYVTTADSNVAPADSNVAPADSSVAPADSTLQQPTARCTSRQQRCTNRQQRCTSRQQSCISRRQRCTS